MADKFIPHGHPKREENLSQFLEGNHPEVPSVAYHGGPRDVGSFNTKFGSWFSEKPSLANEYGSTEGGSVYPVHLSIKRPIEFVHAEQRKKIGEIISHALGGAEDLSSDQIEKAKSLIGRLRQTHGEEPKALFEFWRNDPNVAEFFRTLGYDGITAFEKSDRSNKTWAALYPQQIKSATGNQGTFDPNDPDITKADGGSVDDQDQGIDVYHSSPHEFDRFSLSQIGTGEGNQMYGHGLYFAESPAVSGQGGDYWKQFWNKMPAGPEHSAASALFSNKFDREKAIADLMRAHEYSVARSVPGKYGEGPDVEEGHRLLADQYKAAADMLREGKTAGPRTYEVRIDAHPDHFFDWDKPIEEQHPKVLDAIAPFFPAGVPTKNKYGAPLMGGDLYHEIKERAGGVMHSPILDKAGVPSRLPGGTAERLSRYLSLQGVPGIRYLDQVSRNRGGGTRNYVVFDDKLVTIKRRYAEGGKVESYPLRNHHDWEEAHDYGKTGGKLGYESPSEYLKEVKPLNMDHDDKKLIHHFKKQMKKGEKLDPVAIYPDGHPNGRHRAHAAENLGIKKIPVVKWPEKKKGGGPVVDQALMVISRRRAPPGTPG